jgi:hypothetical protein
MRIRCELVLVLVLLLGVVAAANAQAQASSSPAAAAASAADKDNKPVMVSSDGELLYTGSGGDGGYLSIASVRRRERADGGAGVARARRGARPRPCNVLSVRALLSVPTHPNQKHNKTHSKHKQVMSSVWISAFAICSLVFAISGLAVAYQWPNPRFCCYRTPYSDAPASGAGRACCSLYTLNVGFLVAWMLMLGVMAVSRDIARILVCAGFVLVHGTAVGALRWQYKRKGRPAYPETQMVRGGSGGRRV